MELKGRELGLDGSDLGCAWQSGQSWETHLEMKDFACVGVLRGRQKMWEHHERVERRAKWEEVVGFGWVGADL